MTGPHAIAPAGMDGTLAHPPTPGPRASHHSAAARRSEAGSLRTYRARIPRISAPWDAHDSFARSVFQRDAPFVEHERAWVRHAALLVARLDPVKSMLLDQVLLVQ